MGDIDNKENKNSNAKYKKYYLPTGIDHLDDLLSLGRDKREKHGGIQLRKGGRGKLLETPILLIEGITGVGKTTLALQIAFNIARPKKDDAPDNWKAYLYSLEQSKEALINNALNFGWIESEEETAFLDFSHDNTTTDEKAGPDMIRLCHFSPRPLEKEEDDYVFEQRKEELRHVLEKVSANCKNGEKTYYPFFIIDSLTAFADRNLSRNEIYQLFQLFRDKNIPAVLTVERYNIYTSDQDTISLECAKYLADIVIDLSTDTSNDYFKYRLEIIKSKVCRQALGKHLYKIRTVSKKSADIEAKDNESAETEQKDKKFRDKKAADSEFSQYGIVIYPSLSYVLNKARDESPGNPTNDTPSDFLICPYLVEGNSTVYLKKELKVEQRNKDEDELIKLKAEREKKETKAKKTKERDELDKEIDELKNKEIELKEKIKNLTYEIDELTKEIIKLKNEAKDEKEEIDNKDKKEIEIDELKKEINALKNRGNELFKIFNQTDIKPDSCIAITGPDGTHKLALAINIAVSDMVNRSITVQKKALPADDIRHPLWRYQLFYAFQSFEGIPHIEAPKNKVLILNFGSTNEFDFSGIAWTEHNRYCSKIKKDPDKGTDQTKFWHDEYNNKNDADKTHEMEVTVTTFRMGHLTAEECLDIINKKIESEEKNGGYSAAILTNTSKICTSFPELEKNFLFLPTLIEILSNKNIVSVCICVEAEHGSSTETANRAILSKANYRMYLSHYPTIEKLSALIVNRKIKEAKESIPIKEYIEEQLVSLVVDNVPGKNYIRTPKWLHIPKSVRDPETEKYKRTLICSEEPILKD